MKGMLGIFVLLAFQTQLNAQFRPEEVVTGSNQVNEYLTKIQNKKVGVVANHASLIASTHLVDTLLALDVNIVRIFSPEHGFRGKADAGQHLEDGKDPKTGIQIISLYGDNKEPRKDQLEGLDVIVFDLQDVGTRFYTYISTLTYVMKACAENDVELIVLDRPNPNGHYVDGPVLEPRFKSFVGMHEIPIVYGMTIGEYAKMVRGENWNNTGKCKLSVIPNKNYDHKTFYKLPIKPSPNLPNMKSIYLYPSLCLFEGTVVSIGRGTKKPFQIIGHPDYAKGDYQFVPKSVEGAAKPKLENRTCSGVDLSTKDENELQQIDQLDLKYVIDFYTSMSDQKSFFNNYFNLLAGNAVLKQQIVDGMSETEIRNTWAFELEKFKKIREKYLLYEDFENRIQIR